MIRHEIKLHSNYQIKSFVETCDGQVTAKEFYNRKGQPVGYHVKYNGDVKMQQFYSRGKLKALITSYSDLHPSHIHIYKYNKEYITAYNSNREIICTRVLKNGKPIEERFFVNGYVTAIKKYHKGKILKEIRYDYYNQKQFITIYNLDAENRFDDENIIRKQRNITEKTLKIIMPDSIDRINSIQVGKKYKLISLIPNDTIYTILEKLTCCTFKVRTEDNVIEIRTFLQLMPIE